MSMKLYEQFLAAKVAPARHRGFAIDRSEINPMLMPHQCDAVLWGVLLGCAAIFAAFGLGKTFIQLEIARLILKYAGGRFLIIAPLGVMQEFEIDAAKLGTKIKFIRRIEECSAAGIYITNYETVRDGKLDPRLFTGVSLDEAAILRGFGGTKTFREFMKVFENSQVKYKFVATATPSPNEYIELLAYAAFLDVMDVGQAKTRFFKRDSVKADKLTLHAHKEHEFWLWMSGWALFLQRPSDLGYSDADFDLPILDIRWHEVATDHAGAGYETSGQAKLLRNSAIGVTDAAREKRDSLPRRMEKLMEIRAEDPSAHRLIWHDLEAERHAIEKEIPECVTVFGHQDIEDRKKSLIAFANGEIQEMAGKPSMLGAGGNYQRHCAWAIFLGIGFKFNDFIQAIHRIHRFLQTRRVRIDLIYTEAEREVRRVLERKWEQHKVLTAKMSEIIREYGLVANALAKELRRSMGLERQEAAGENFRLVNDDAVYDVRRREENSVSLILTSIPFSTQYEYTPSFNDFGHTDDNGHFWRQMDFLTPELFRILQPGRVAAIHVKDRISPGGLTGFGFQTVQPFHCEAIFHYLQHGFAYLGMKTIVTDVVRENNQTYRLGWTEQCKDGSRMGVGMPEYLLLFRKPPTDSANGYADLPVIKSKNDYSRSRWQIDAHGFMRSSGNRLLAPEDLDGIPHERIFKMFRKFSLEEVYDFERHVALSESLERCPDCRHIHTGRKSCGFMVHDQERNAHGVCNCLKSGGRLPVTFMLLQPQSWSEEVYTDIVRMRTLNGDQYAAGREMHLCPLQFDLADRVIAQFSMEGETVYDPFGGLGTVPCRAVKLKRRGESCELNPRYFADSIRYCQLAENAREMPTLFDLAEAEVSI